MFEQYQKSRDSVALGIGLTLLLHLIQVPMFMISGGRSFFLIGLSQLIYMIPAIVIARQKGRSRTAKGLAIGASITLLLNGACFSAITLSLKNL